MMALRGNEWFKFLGRDGDSNDDVAVSSMDRRVSRPPLTRAQIAAIGGIALFAAAASYGYVRYGLQRTLSMDAERLVISTVQPGSFHDYIPITGNVEPRETVYLDAIDGGQVLEVLVEEGAMVKQGQPLVRLNNTNLQLQLINSEAQLSEQLNRLTATKLAFEQSRLAHSREMIDMQFQVEQATQRLKRMQSLADTGAIKRSDIEDAELDLNRLRDLYASAQEAKRIDEQLQREQMQQIDKTVASLNNNLAVARQNLENLTIKASIAGQLTSLEAHIGESKRPGQRIGQIDQIDTYKVTALVDEHYLPRVAVGQSATAEIDGQEHRMELIKQYAEVRERQFKVDLAFNDEVPKSVRRGQSLQLRLAIGASSQGLVVANGPFYEDTGGQWAFVIDGTEAHRRPIKFGRRNPESVEVLEGLSADERVITSSYESLKDFSRIELRGEAK
ncbi:MAG TPA: HlyD family efflux transporter periplasmic adaptor subunit [Steroidobacteraceae bacterium]|nr:HlyD family efflux transporter periplasmic adaptor subunit [Steroidobacteraceae bacterium]